MLENHYLMPIIKRKLNLFRHLFMVFVLALTPDRSERRTNATKWELF